MPRLLTRVSILLFALFVMGGLAFGASTVLGTSSVEECGDDLGEIGTCPPLTQQNCPEACLDAGFFEGFCHDDCCTCLT